MPLSEHVYCVVITFKMTEQVEQWICIKFCIGLNIPLWKLFKWFRRLQLWATSDWQLHHHNMPAHADITSCEEFFGKTSNHPGDSMPLQLRFGALLFFPKTKITFEREDISDHQWDSIKYEVSADGDGRTVWGLKVPTGKRTEASLSYVQCFLYLLQ